MEIVTEFQHRLFAFIHSCNHSNYSPTDEEIIAWFDSPLPREAEYTTETIPPVINHQITGIDSLQKIMRDMYRPNFDGMMERITSNINSPFENLTKPRTVRKESRPAENPLEHMLRIGWLNRATDDRLKVTDIGRAMLQTAENEATLIEDLTVMYLGADDPLSYPLLVGTLAVAEAGLLVDPFLKVEQVVDLHQHTRINRLLVGSGERHRRDNVAISRYLQDRNDDDQVEVRMSGQLHDRVFIEPNGSLSMLGTSMNGVGRKATVLMSVPDVAAQPLTAHYETLWDEAEVLYPVKDQGEDSAEERATDDL